jgi:deoxyribodipyrimidine photo-lyase
VTPALVWFRSDLRLRDNPALAAALGRGGPVIPVFVLDDEGEGGWAPGGASRWWLHHALACLGDSLEARGSRLLLARGASREVLLEIAGRTGAGAVFWNRRYEPAARARDAAVAAGLAERGVEARSFNGSLLFEPGAIANRQGGPFQVFTPFWRHCLEQPVPPPVPVPSGPIPGPSRWPRLLGLGDLGLLPRIPWDEGLREAWRPGERHATLRLRRFVGGALGDYASRRDRPDLDGTSMISPWLHFGELGPRQVWAAVARLSQHTGVFPAGNGARAFLAELGWREFAHHLLFHFPRTPTEPLRGSFARFPWDLGRAAGRLAAWQRGATGYPIVDAGMRQLWSTGWMHNRVRMITASFLVKHMLVPWQEGARWFWNTLVDADLANNTLGWQWTAGCGADAAPFFRIFAPVRQGEKSDPLGAYVRRWVPELGRLPDEFIHRPWEAPPGILASAGVALGSTYPRPVVDHAQARADALRALGRMRAASGA